MRRRIRIDPEGAGMDDVTNSPYLYDLGDFGALYDDALWARYLAACEEWIKINEEVENALVYEPLDAVERELAAQADSFLHGGVEHDIDAHVRLGERAVEHAKTVTRPPLKRWVVERVARTDDPSEATWTEYLGPKDSWSRSLSDAALFEDPPPDRPGPSSVQKVHLIAPQPRADGNGSSGWFVLDRHGQLWEYRP